MKKIIALCSRFLFIFLAVLIALPGLAGRAQASAQEYVPDLTPVQEYGDYSYKVYTDGTVEIVDYNGQESDVMIPSELGGERVTVIGSEAFAYYEMSSLTIPEGVDVSGRAFEYCKITEALNLPAGVAIGVRAFEYAELPKTVFIPEGAVLEGDCFSYCENLERLFVEPSSVIKGSAFSYSEDLRTLFCAPGSKFADRAFEYCYRLTAVVLCGDVKLDGKPFSYCRNARVFHEDEIQYAIEVEKALGLQGKRGKTDKQPGSEGRNSGMRIGEEAALKIALDDAGLTQKQVRDIDVELDRNLSAEYYEVDFEQGVYEYEYRIEASSGEILSAKRVRD